MKTTIDIADGMLAEAKRVAAAEGVTLRELVTEGLSRALAARRRPGDYRLADASFGGRGLQPGVPEGDWSTVRELVYEGRGG